MDLKKSAITIIYADGCIESIPIEIGKYYHYLYYEKLVLISERFKTICGACKFEKGIHYQIDKTLIESNAIVLQNWDVRDISICMEEGNAFPDLPDFGIYLPAQFGSIKQVEEFEYLIRDYPVLKRTYYKYINQDLGFTDNYSNEELLNEIEEFKNENIERRN